MSYNAMSIKEAKVMTITPEIAQFMLNNNVGNRSIKPSTVRSYAIDMASGNWKLTHQGIAFNSNGQLVDGQHRLSAIIQSGASVQMLVCTYNEDIGAINSPLDLQAKRSISDILGKDPITIAVMQFIISELGFRSSGRNETKTMKFIENLGEKYYWLEDNLSYTSTRLFSSAPIKAACFVAYLCGHDWSKQYNIIITNDVKALDSSAYLLYKKLSPYIGMTNTKMFRDLSFNSTFAVASGMMDHQKIFTSALFERARAKAIATVSPYFK